MSAAEQTPKLFAALVRAQASARAVPLDSKNEFHRYRYASAESIIDEGRAALGSAGLVLSTLDVEVVSRSLPRVVTSKSDRAEMGPHEVVVRVTLLLAHESGESRVYVREWPAVEEKGRPLDKAVAAALTNGLAYSIRDLLLLPRDDDAASMDRRDDPHEEAPRREEPRREPPAESTRTGNAPTSSSSGDVYSELLAAMARGELEAVGARIDGADLPADTKKLLHFVAEAWEAPTKEAFAKVGAKVRSSGLSQPWIDEAMTQIRPAWDALSKGRAA